MNCEWISFILTTQTGSLRDAVFQTQATFSLCLQSAPIELPVLDESSFLVSKCYEAFKSKRVTTIPSANAGSTRLSDASTELGDPSTLYHWLNPVKHIRNSLSSPLFRYFRSLLPRHRQCAADHLPTAN